jgi:tetratricopeptide (TPR) repeat protein
LPSSRTRVGSVTFAPALALLASLTLAVLACGGGGGDFEERLAEMRALQDEGKAAETLEQLTALSADHLDHPELNYRLGLAMIASGRPTEAVFPLDKAAATQEFAVPAGILLASTLANTDNHAGALRAATRVLEHEPDHEAALLLRATSAAQLHDGATALESAERLVAIAPDNRNFAYVRATALAEATRLDDAERQLRELLDADWQSEPQGFSNLCIGYARFLFDKRNDADRAIGLMKECIEKQPDDIQLLGAIGGMLNELQRGDDLVPILEAAAERHPEARRLQEGLVAQLVSEDRVDDAKQLAEKLAAEADDARGWSQVAVVRRRTGDLSGALEAVDKALALAEAGQEQELRFFRAELLIELGRIDEAEQQAAQVTDELSRTILDARLAQQRGDNQRALELYGKVSIQWPQNHAVRALAARAAHQLGDTERAKSDLLEATRQAPKDTDAALWLAQIYFSEGNFRQCLAFASRHIKERGVLDPAAYLLSAEALAASNHVEDALVILADLEKQRDGAFRGVAWAAAARLRARTDPAEALAKLEQQLEQAGVSLADPASTPLLDTVVDLQMRGGRSADAARRVAALLAKRPDSAHLHAMRGRIALAADELDAAVAAFERALALDPNESLALSGLALVHQHRGELAQAIEAMRKAAAAAPETSDYAYMTARMVLDQGDRAAGRKELERVVLQHPDSVAAANDLAFLLAEESSDLAAALRHAERAVRLDPSPETLDTLGFVKLRQGAAEEAVGMFERALSRRPDYATARYHLALALIEKGEPMAARQALEEALAQPFPEQQEARKVLAKIDSDEGRP